MTDDERDDERHREGFEAELRHGQESRKHDWEAAKSAMLDGNVAAAGKRYGYDLGSAGSSLESAAPAGMVRIGMVEDYWPDFGVARIWVTEPLHGGDRIWIRSERANAGPDQAEFEQPIRYLEQGGEPVGADRRFVIIAVDRPVRSWDVIYRRLR